MFEYLIKTLDRDVVLGGDGFFIASGHLCIYKESPGNPVEGMDPADVLSHSTLVAAFPNPYWKAIYILDAKDADDTKPAVAEDYVSKGVLQ